MRDCEGTSRGRKTNLPRPRIGERSLPVQKKSSFFFSSSVMLCTTFQKLTMTG